MNSKLCVAPMPGASFRPNASAEMPCKIGLAAVRPNRPTSRSPQFCPKYVGNNICGVDREYCTGELYACQDDKG